MRLLPIAEICVRHWRNPRSAAAQAVFQDFLEEITPSRRDNLRKEHLMRMPFIGSLIERTQTALLPMDQLWSMYRLGHVDEGDFGRIFLSESQQVRLRAHRQGLTPKEHERLIVWLGVAQTLNHNGWRGRFMHPRQLKNIIRRVRRLQRELDRHTAL